MRSLQTKKCKNNIIAGVRINFLEQIIVCMLVELATRIKKGKKGRKRPKEHVEEHKRRGLEKTY